jgi:hypothetical protein
MLSVSDVSIDSRINPKILFVTLKQSKTDVFGSGVTLHLGKTGDTLCPVTALLAYLVKRPNIQGPLFILKSGNPLSRDTLVSAVRQALKPSMDDTSLFNGHSFRIGAATAAAQAGIPDSSIMQLGRWRSSVFTRYIRPPVEAMAAMSRRLIE